MRKLSREQRIQVVNCLIEGCSIRATVRMTGVAKKTVMRVLVEAGQICEEYQDRVLPGASHFVIFQRAGVEVPRGPGM
jgi:transposase-like protein